METKIIREKNNGRRNSFLPLISGILLFTFIAISVGSGSLTFKNAVADSVSYHLNLTSANKPNIPAIGFGTGTSLSRQVGFAYSEADDNVSGQHVKLSMSGGAITNTTLISGLSSFTATFSGGTLTLYFGNTPNPIENATALVSGGEILVSDFPYFKVVAGGTEDTLVESLSMIYSCASPETTGLVLTDLGSSYSVTGYTGSATSVNIPAYHNGKLISAIGTSAFNNDSDLISITIPRSVTSIGGSAFSGCSNLESMTLPFVGATLDGASNTHFGYIFGASSYSVNNSFIPASLKTVTITGETAIRNYAFYQCGLTSITLLNGLVSIGNRVFSGCNLLTSITLPNSLTSIGQGAFIYCSGLTSVTLPSGLTIISDLLFYYCNNLSSVTIPNGVTRICPSAFSFCTRLTSIALPSSLTSIGSDAFSDCSGLTSMTIPNSVTSIEGGAFSGCAKITSITIPSGVTSIENSTFDDCTGLTSISIPGGITNIGNSAFFNCRKLTSITIPSGVTRIGASAFSGCNGLTTITIPAGVTIINDYVFDGCYALTSITIPSGVTSIGSYAFSNCRSLAAITIPIDVASIGSNAFYGCDSLTIYAEIASKPLGWNASWNPNSRTVVWGYTE